MQGQEVPSLEGHLLWSPWDLLLQCRYHLPAPAHFTSLEPHAALLDTMPHCHQPCCTVQPEPSGPSGEELTEKPPPSRQSNPTDYYQNIRETRRDMDNVKHHNTTDTLQSRPPAASLSSSPRCLSSDQTGSVHISTTAMKDLSSSKQLPEKEKKLLGKMNLGDMKSITSLKKSGLSERLAPANKMVVLPTEEANLSDIDYLVPTHDDKGRPIAEWRRQVMVRQLQARLLDDEAQRRKLNGNRYAKIDSWRYSHAHNAILGPFGEMLTEDDLIYLEKQIQCVAMQKNCKGYETELARLVEELQNILPPPIVNITVNTQYRNPNMQVKLPVWCNRIAGIVMRMSLLMSDLSDGSTSKMPNSELVTVFSQNPERQNSARGRREEIENEIHEFGVSVQILKSNFENQGSLVALSLASSGLEAQTKEPPPEHPEQKEEHHSDIDYDEAKNVMESTSLRKERIVVLFLGHWKRSAYAVTARNAQRKLSMDSAAIPDKSSVQRKASLDITSKKLMEQGSLGQFFKQRSAVSKMIGNWRSMISIVPSEPIQTLNKQQSLFSPEQFLPRVNGAPFEYDSLTLDLFMLGYFHILEQDLSSEERKMRHLLCFEVFDHLGHFSWETVRDFHKAVIQDIEAGNREWTDGFEDIKIRFFSEVVSQPETRSPEKTPQAQMRPVPKVIIQTPTPDEDDVLTRSADFTNLSNEEICKYIDRSFAFWKEKEAEIFDFEVEQT